MKHQISKLLSASDRSDIQIPKFCRLESLSCINSINYQRTLLNKAHGYVLNLSDHSQPRSADAISISLYAVIQVQQQDQSSDDVLGAVLARGWQGQCSVSRSDVSRR